jgi:hypothetical protein
MARLVCSLLALAIATVVHCEGGAQSNAAAYDSLFNQTFEFPLLNIATNGIKVANVWKIPTYSPNLRALVSSRLPFMLTNHSARSWEAVTWNLMQMYESGHWSTLFGVISLPSKTATTCNATDNTTYTRAEPSVFFSQSESAEGSVARHSPAGSGSAPFNMVTQMSMLEFLTNIFLQGSTNSGGDQTASNSRRYLYSTEFDGLVDELQVTLTSVRIGVHSADICGSVVTKQHCLGDAADRRVALQRQRLLY